MNFLKCKNCADYVKIYSKQSPYRKYCKTNQCKV